MPLGQTVQTGVNLYAEKRYVGQIDTLQLNNVTDAILDTAVAAFGVPLARTATGVKPFTLVGDAFVGIAVRKQTVMNTYNSEVSPTYAIGSVPAILNFGYIVVTAESNVTKGGSVFIRYAAGSGAVLGAIRADADTATAVEVPTVKFAESALAGELVRVVITQIAE
jgi:hypothetical protein